MSRSKYIRTQREKLPRHKRSERLDGSFEDSNKWIKCWNCGFVNDLTKVTLGEGSGIEVTEIVVPYDPYVSGDVRITLDTLTMVGVLLENGPDGNPITDYYTPRIAKAVRGCKMCGCQNLP
jgi:hypothetical protein